MTEYRNIIVVQANEAGQPTNLLALGENDTIADEVLSPEVRDAATKADEALTKANEVSGKNDEVSSYINANQTSWEEGLDAVTRADIVTTSNALVGFQNTSGAEIKLSYEGNADVTPFTPASATKFNGIAAGAEVNVYNTDSDIKTAYENNADVTPFTPTSATKFNGIDAGAQVNVYNTDSDIKTAYENNAGVAPFTTTSATKFNGIETGATADQTDSEIETAYNNQVAQVDGPEKTNGTETGVRRFSPKDIADMAGTHGGGGGGGGIPNPIDENLDMTGFNIVNANEIIGRTSAGNSLSLSSPNTVALTVGVGADVPASGNINFFASTINFKPDPYLNPNFNIKLGMGLLVTDTSGVPVSGHDGTTVDAPPDGAALVLDTAEGLFKYQKIKAINIADGAVGAGQIANGAVGDDQIGTISIDDHTNIGSIALNRLIGGGNETFLGRTATTGPNGPMEYMTKEQARTILNGGNQEITGNVGINTAATPTAPLQIEDTGTADAIYIESSDAGADAGPVITLKRDSASPAGADYLGQLKFKGESSTGAERVYAKITAKIDDPTNGSEDGALEIANRYNGANQIAVRLKEDSFRLLNSVELHVDGNTGLGTNNPSEKLDVQGNIAVTGTVDGRDIATDGTKLDGIEGAFAVGTTAPTSPTGGDLWYNTTDDELYTYDSGRGHWLGAPYYISFGKSVSTSPGVGHFLYVGHQGTTATSSERGWLVPHDMVITGWRGHTQSTFTDWTFRIDKNSGGTNTTGIVSTGALGAVDTFSDFTTDVDVAAGDILGVAGVTGTSTLNNSTVTVKIQRKGA